jgi:hypothetical protein
VTDLASDSIESDFVVVLEGPEEDCASILLELEARSTLASDSEATGPHPGAFGRWGPRPVVTKLENLCSSWRCDFDGVNAAASKLAGRRMSNVA